MKSIAVTLLAVLMLVPGVSALTITQDLEIQPNGSTTGWYRVADASKSLDELEVNITDATFFGTNSGIWNDDTDAELCAFAVNCTLPQTNAVVNITFLDPEPPDINWSDPTANGTEAAEKNYILWNISSTENISQGFIEINGTNNTCTIVNNSANSQCSFNQTGLAGASSHCSVGWAADPSGNTNRTTFMICRTTNITVVVVVPPEAEDIFIAFDHMLNYIFLLGSEIMEAWYSGAVYGEMWFHNDTAQGVITSIASQNVWVNVSGFEQPDESGQTLMDVSFSDNALVADESGIYKVEYSMSFSNVGNNQEYNLAIAVNNERQNNTEVHRKIGAAGDVGNAGGTGFINLSVNDVVTLMVINMDGTADVGTHAANVNIFKVGEL